MNDRAVNPLHNPFKRLRERQGISQYELGRRTGLTKHAVLRLEQGMYPNPLPTILDYFTSQFPNLSHVTLEREYTDFQIAMRQHNSRLLGDIIEELRLTPVGTHPLTYLRESRGINPTELAKRLCIAQSVVAYFEKRSVHQHTVPQQLIEALWDADYTEAETHALEEAYTDYRERLKSERGFISRSSDRELETNGV